MKAQATLAGQALALALTLLCSEPVDLRAQGAEAQGAEPAPTTRGEEAPLITDRPDFTESPVAVAPGLFQLEGGYTFSRDAGEDTHTLGEILLRIGILPRLEARIGLNSFVVSTGGGEPAGALPTSSPRSVRGLDDVTLAVKVELIRPPPSSPAVPRLGIIAGTSLPTGRSDIGADALQPGVLLAAAWELTGRLGLGTNFGYAYLEDEAGRFDELSGSVVFGFSLTERLGTFAEYFGTFPVGSSRESDNFADAGVTYLLGPSLQLDMRVGLGLDGPRPNYFLGTGASWRW